MDRSFFGKQLVGRLCSSLSDHLSHSLYSILVQMHELMDEIFFYKKLKIKNLKNDFQSIVKNWSGIWSSPGTGTCFKEKAETKILAEWQPQAAEEIIYT